MKYIIKILIDCNIRYTTWYGGKDFSLNYEKYACYTSCDEARRYSSRKVAEHVADRLMKQCSNVWKTEIEEVNE